MRFIFLLISCSVLGLCSWQSLASFDEAGERQLQDLREKVIRVTGAQLNQRRIAVEALEELLPGLKPDEQQLVSSLLPKLKAPELLVGRDDEERQAILQTSQLSVDHPALQPLQEIIEAVKALPSKLQDYGQRLSEIYAGFMQKLVDTAPEVRPLLLDPAVELSGIGLGHYLINQQMARDLLSINDQGKLQKLNTQGNSPVIAKINKEEGWGIHFKADGRRVNSALPPLQPGLEASVYWFYQLLLGQGITPTCALALNNVSVINDNNTNTQDYVVQASTTVLGTDFQEWMLDYSKAQHSLNDIPASSLSAHFVVSLLINLGDAKPDNYRLNQQNELIGIDNDHVFVDEFKKSDKILDISGENFMGIRCLFYAWQELLKTPIDPTVKQRLSKALNHPQGVIQFLSRWLQKLEAFNEEGNRLSSQGYLSSFWFEPQTFIHKFDDINDLDENGRPIVKTREEIQPALFPILLPQNILTHLQAKLCKLQPLLVNPWIRNHGQLFKHMNPFTEAYYRHVVEKLKKGAPINIAQPIEALSYIYQGIRSMEEELRQGGEDIRKLLSVKDSIPLTYSSRLQTVQTQLSSFIESFELNALPPAEQRLMVEALIPVLGKDIPASWKRNGLLGRLIEEGISLSALEWFIKSGIDINVVNSQAQTLLHHAVLYSQKDARHALEQILTLLKYKPQLEALDKQHLTPLSLAMANNFIEATKELILAGAGEKTNFRVAAAFYDKHIKGKSACSLSSTFEILRRRNSRLDWHLAFEHLLPIHAEGTYIQTVNYGTRVLPAELMKFNKKGGFVRQNRYGRRDVVLIEAYGHKLYMKRYPELPGLEEAVGRLTRKLIGYGAPHVELINLHNEPVLVSQAIDGDTMQDVLNYNPQKLQKLDAKNLSEMLLVAMLLNPEDGKPDNYIMQPLSDNSNLYRIQGVDNDHAFVPAVAREQKENWGKSHEVVQVKTVLYCLDQMLQPIHPDVRLHFMMLDPAAILRSWLIELKDVNDRFIRLFDDNQIHTFLQKHDCFMGIPFRENTIPYLYQKILRMQRILEENEQLTHHQLLTNLEPQLGKRYQQVLHKDIPVKNRFEEVDGVFYSKAIAGHHLTKINSRHLLKSMEISDKKTIMQDLREGKSYSPLAGLKQLKEAIQQQTHDMLTMDAIEKQGLIQILNQLRLPELQEKVLENLDFKQMTAQRQQTVINWLQAQKKIVTEWRNLHLKNCNLLTDQDLSNMEIGNITSLDLRGANQIRENVFVLLSQKCPRIEILNFSNNSNFLNIGNKYLNRYNEKYEFNDIIFPYLRYLYLRYCPTLRSINLNSSNLILIDLDGCSAFNEFKVIAPSLTRINLRYHLSISGALLDSIKITTFPHLSLIALEGCEVADPEALYYLGLLFEKGKGVVQNYEEALSYFKKAADQNHANAQYKLGMVYEYGVGIEKDHEESSKWYEEALKPKTKFPLKPIYRKLGELRTINDPSYVLVNLSLMDQDIDHIICCLPPTLTSLDLNTNNIGDIGAMALSQNTTLLTLDLTRNKIGNEGAAALAQNTTLTSLILTKNEIGDKGAIAFAQNSTLTSLSLGRNNVKDIGAKALVQNTALKYLSLYQNKIIDREEINFIKHKDLNLKLGTDHSFFSGYAEPY